MDSDLPRSYRRLPTGYRQAISYLRPAAPSVLSLGPSVALDTSSETRVANSERVTSSITIPVSFDDVAHLVSDQVAVGKSRVRDSLARLLRQRKRVVDVDAEPQYRTWVEVHVVGFVSSWEKIPGVTDLPYQPVSDPLAFPLTREEEDLFRAILRAVDEARVKFFDVVLLCNTITQRYVDRSMWVEYLPRSVIHPDIPTGRVVVASVLG